MNTDHIWLITHWTKNKKKIQNTTKNQNKKLHKPFKITEQNPLLVRQTYNYHYYTYHHYHQHIIQHLEENAIQEKTMFSNIATVFY